MKNKWNNIIKIQNFSSFKFKIITKMMCDVCCRSLVIVVFLKQNAMAALDRA